MRKDAGMERGPWRSSQDGNIQKMKQNEKMRAQLGIIAAGSTIYMSLDLPTLVEYNLC